MKRYISLFLLLLLMISFTACTDIFEQDVETGSFEQDYFATTEDSVPETTSLETTSEEAFASINTTAGEAQPTETTLPETEPTETTMPVVKPTETVPAETKPAVVDREVLIEKALKKLKEINPDVYALEFYTETDEYIGCYIKANNNTGAYFGLEIYKDSGNVLIYNSSMRIIEEFVLP